MTVDYYTDFFESNLLETETTLEVINKLWPNFVLHGIPVQMSSDVRNLTPYNFRKFQRRDALGIRSPILTKINPMAKQTARLNKQRSHLRIIKQRLIYL